MTRDEIVNKVKSLIKSNTIKAKIEKEKYKFTDIELIYFIDKYSLNGEERKKYLEALLEIIQDKKISLFCYKIINYIKTDKDLFYSNYDPLWSMYYDKLVEDENKKGIIYGIYRPEVSMIFKIGDKVKIEVNGKIYEGVVSKNKFGTELNPCCVYVNKNCYINCNYEELELL